MKESPLGFEWTSTQGTEALANRDVLVAFVHTARFVLEGEERNLAICTRVGMVGLATRSSFRPTRRMDAVAPSSLPLIQLAITPVILISGVGGLMLSLMNRMGRVVDRSRALATQLRTAAAEERPHVDSQLTIMWRRAKLVRGAVTCAALSMLLSCTLVMMIFVSAWMGWDFATGLVFLFVASVAMLIAALVAFLRDIFISLHALGIEVDRARQPK